MRSRPAAVLAAAALLAACTGSGGEPASIEDRRFCELLETAPPAADPFEPGIDPAEVERRVDDLRDRFADLAASAPDELAADLAELERALSDLDEVLAAEDHDLVALAETSPDLSPFDDPRFEEIGARIADHRAAACD